MKKTMLNTVADELMRASVKATKQNAQNFLGLFDMGQGDDDTMTVDQLLNKITLGMKRASAREAIQRAVEYSDKNDLSPEDENYIITLLEKYLE